MYGSAQCVMLPCSTFSTRATRKISTCGSVTEKTPCNRYRVGCQRAGNPYLHRGVWPQSSRCPFPQPTQTLLRSLLWMGHGGSQGLNMVKSWKTLLGALPIATSEPEAVICLRHRPKPHSSREKLTAASPQRTATQCNSTEQAQLNRDTERGEKSVLHPFYVAQA